MRTIKGVFVVIALLTGITMWSGCKDDGGDDNGGANHNVGYNCMICHKSGGGGEGIFTAAGTVYLAGTSTGAAAVTIRLYNSADGSGSPVVTMTSEVSGNFHYSKAVNFGTGLYPRVTSAKGTSAMAGPITSGACNSCHGTAGTGKITVQ